MRIAVIITCIALVQGCSIHQNVKPVASKDIEMLTIIENPDVKGSFLKALREDIEAEGIQTNLAPARSPVEEYPYALTYTANWAWDLALYMVYTDIEVFKDGKSIGSAVYDSRYGGGNMAKFINAEQKIDELVEELFPNGQED